MKPKKCKSSECKKEFEPMRSLQQVCSWVCALAWNKQKDEKKQRKTAREMKASLKTRGAWLKEAQVEFNKFIRLRDADLPCISCQRHHTGQYHAGHYRSVGAALEHRFNEDNVHKQCSACNNFKSGNAIEYRINLVKKIGIDRVEHIEQTHNAKHYNIDQIKEIKLKYRNKCREIIVNNAAEQTRNAGC